MANEQPSWCGYTECVIEDKARKRVCCGARDRDSCLSVFHEEDITDAIAITDGDLQTHAWSFNNGAVVPESVLALNNIQRRLLAYAKLHRAMHGIGKAGVKVPLPSCCRKRISVAYN